MNVSLLAVTTSCSSIITVIVSSVAKVKEPPGCLWLGTIPPRSIETADKICLRIAEKTDGHTVDTHSDPDKTLVFVSSITYSLTKASNGLNTLSLHKIKAAALR